MRIEVDQSGKIERLMAHCPQQSRRNPDLNGGIMHFLVVGNQHGAGDFGAGNEEIVKSAGTGFNGDFDRFVHEFAIMDNGPMRFDIIRSLDAPFVLSGEPRAHGRHFNNSNGRNMHNGFFIFDFLEKGFCDRIQPELLFVKRVLLFPSRGNDALCQNRRIQCERIHQSYSLSRISRINRVESASDTLSFSMSLFNADSGMGFLGLFNSDIKECNSSSTLSSFFMSTDSSMAANYEYGLFKGCGCMAGIEIIRVEARPPFL